MKKSLIFMSIMAAVVMASCSKALPQPEQVTVNPSPLVVVGNKVNADITGTFPVKKFAKRGVLTVTPVLKFEDGEAYGQPVTYVGERAKVNGTVVSYREGGTYRQSVSFDYIPNMKQSELYLRFTAKIGKKVVEVPDLKIADGVITTAKMATAGDVKIVVTPDKFQRIIQEVQEADIRFLIQQANLRQSELNRQEMKDLKAALKETKSDDRKEINNIEVSGYASPDGELNMNEKLAQRRQKASQTYLQRELKRQKINHDIESDITAEDWAGFQAAMENSSLKDKDLVLRVLSMYSDPEEREAQIKNLSSVYKSIAKDILPELRRSRLILTTDLIGKSDDEILALLKSAPAQLNVEELLYAATLVNTEAEKIEVYNKVAVIYNDYRAYNNLSLIAFNNGNLEEAKAQNAKALTVAPDNADVNFNAALIAMEEGDVKQAEIYLGKASGTAGNMQAAMGTLAIMKGDYKGAKKALSGLVSNNAAVEQIISEDYAGARKTLKSIATPDANTYYLLAVVGARTNDRDAVILNLRQAINMDASLKEAAATDIEFAKYFEVAAFKALVK